MEESTSSLPYNLKETLGSRLILLMNTFTSALYLSAIGVLAGLILKFLNIPGKDVVFVMAMGALAFLLLLQIGLSLVYIYRHLPLALLGAFSSLSLAMAFITFIFLFQGWWGSYILIFLTMPLFLISIGFLIWFFITAQHKHTTHRKFIYGNILAPYILIALLTLVYIIQPNRRINKTKPTLSEIVMR